MRVLLAFADLIDRLNEACGRVLPWAVLAAVLLAVGNALARKFDAGSNALLEAQWYLVSAVFLLGAGRVLSWTNTCASTSSRPVSVRAAGCGPTSPAC
jgi:TRAP-type mannitol/chloroaromatic compound transport system permease small subunit